MFGELFLRIKKRHNLNQALEVSINNLLTISDFYIDRNIGKAKEALHHAQILYSWRSYDYDLAYRINQASYSCIGKEFGIDNLDDLF